MNHHQQNRQHLWISVATAVARSESARHLSSPAEWADHALKAFDATFPEQQPEPPVPPKNQYGGPFLCRECHRPMSLDPAARPGIKRWICPCGNTASRPLNPEEL